MDEERGPYTAYFLTRPMGLGVIRKKQVCCEQQKLVTESGPIWDKALFQEKAFPPEERKKHDNLSPPILLHLDA